MSSGGNKSYGYIEFLRLFTPLGVAVLLAYVQAINSHLNELDSKLFKHLTNDEIHTPKSIVVTKPEFSIYQEFRKIQMDELSENQLEIRRLLEEYTRKSNK